MIPCDFTCLDTKPFVVFIFCELLILAFSQILVFNKHGRQVKGSIRSIVVSFTTVFLARYIVVMAIIMVAELTKD